MSTLFIVARLAAALMLLWAVAPQFFQMPSHRYSFFELLRVVVCAVCALGVYCAIQWKQVGWAWTFGSLALLFNPFVKVALGRDTWNFVDIVVAVFLIASIFLLKEKKDSSNQSP
jgi:hypothetical protein